MSPLSAVVGALLSVALVSASDNALPRSAPESDFTVRRVSYAPGPVHQALKHRSDVVLPAAEYSLPIAGSVPRSTRRKQLREQLRVYYNPSKAAGGPYVAPVEGSDFDEEYLVNITAGGNQHFSVIVDTGR